MNRRLLLHARSAASAGLAAAICMAIVQVIWLAMGDGAADALLYGFSISFIAFGGTYAAVFFTALTTAGRRRR